MSNKKRISALYIVFDVIAAIITWSCFFIFRKYHVNPGVFENLQGTIFNDYKFYIGIVSSPLYWVFLHAVSGAYNRVFHKSRLKELGTTLLVTFIGTLLFFFAFILDDVINDYSDYLLYYAILFSLQFVLTYLPKVVVTTHTINKIRNGEVGFNTLVVGCGELARDTYRSLTNHTPNSGNIIVGYIKMKEDDEDFLANELVCLGSIDRLLEIVKEHEVAELIIALQNGSRKYVENIIATIMDTDLSLKIIPQMQDYLMGNVRVSSILQEPLISLSPDALPDWQKHLKRFCDIFFSLIAIILLLPVYLVLAIGVKASSKGPVFYTQERIGYKGKPFQIIKFRSMVENAENGCPQLSSSTDPRITRFGKFLRKTRLDETPQFINVLVGDMSLVGPRPERQYYIDQIVKKAPHYRLLFRIRPGITSWGQVKYGYAENVDEMVERLKWDILYIENMSLQMDIKILIYTILIVLKRSGK